MPAKRILVVDDDDSILVLLEKRLQTDGYQVIKASTGKEAVAKAKLFSPALVLMDIMLPDVDGPEAFKLLRAQAETSRIPVVFLSGIINENVDASPTVTIDGEVHPAVAKPIEFGILTEAIEDNILSEPEGSPE